MRKVRWVLILAMGVTAIALVAGTGLFQGGGSTALAQGPSATGDRPPRAQRPEPAEREDDEGRRGMRVAPMFRDITDEDVAGILKFVGEHMPWMKADLEKMRESAPSRVRLVCRHLRFEIAQLERLKEQDPDAFRRAIEEKQLKFRSQELAAKVRAAADPKERQAQRGELRGVLDRLFDAETATRAAQIRQLESRLQTLRKELQDRTASRREIVDKRLDAMLKVRPESPRGTPPAPHPPEK
jgi:hypothetical protein